MQIEYKTNLIQKCFTWEVDFGVLVAHVGVAAMRVILMVEGSALEGSLPWMQIVFLEAITSMGHTLSSRLGNKHKAQARCVACLIYTSLTKAQ